MPSSKRYPSLVLPLPLLIARTTTDQRLRLRDGRWLGYVDYGDPTGTPIICCHGTPGSRIPELSIRLQQGAGYREAMGKAAAPGTGISCHATLSTLAGCNGG
jgi:hypothetical protein